MLCQCSCVLAKRKHTAWGRGGRDELGGPLHLPVSFQLTGTDVSSSGIGAFFCSCEASRPGHCQLMKVPQQPQSNTRLHCIFKGACLQGLKPAGVSGVWDVVAVVTNEHGRHWCPLQWGLYCLLVQTLKEGCHLQNRWRDIVQA